MKRSIIAVLGVMAMLAGAAVAAKADEALTWGMHITSPGTYSLAADLSGTAAGAYSMGGSTYAFYVDSDNVTVNLNGHTLKPAVGETVDYALSVGDWGSGTGQTNVVVQGGGGHITGFRQIADVLTGSTGFRFNQTSCTGVGNVANSYNGIFIYQTNDWQVTNSSFDSFGQSALLVWSCGDGLIKGNTVQHNGSQAQSSTDYAGGISVKYADGLTIENNTVRDNYAGQAGTSGAGIGFWGIAPGADETIVQWNEISGNEGAAVRFNKLYNTNSPGSSVFVHMNNNNLLGNETAGDGDEVAFDYSGVQGTWNVDGENNWWGSTVEAELAAKIDYDTNSSVLDYIPFRTTPTPEPATLGLLAAGGVAALLRRRRGSK